MCKIKKNRYLSVFNYENLNTCLKKSKTIVEAIDPGPDCPATVHRFPHKALQILKIKPVNNAYSLGC
jgi:hypothetical protein